MIITVFLLFMPFLDVMNCRAIQSTCTSRINADFTTEYQDSNRKHSIATSKPSRRFNRQAILGDYNADMRWPNARVPFVISSDYDESQRNKILGAMKEFNTNGTCIRFVPRINENDFLFIEKSGRGCYSLYGRQGGNQSVSLDDFCLYPTESDRAPTVLHELMHALGFWHELDRYDRDDYVTINWENIEKENHHLFEKQNPKKMRLLGTEYDFRSIMHYSPTFGGINENLPTYTAKDGSSKTEEEWGNIVLSKSDVLKLNRFYDCNIDCWDENFYKDICSERVEDGECVSNTMWMLTNCKKSCNFCKFSEPKPKSDSNCEDIAEPNICLYNEEEGNCHNIEYGDYFKINCKKSCGFCKPCNDLYPNCADEAEKGNCKNIDIQAVCKSSCDVC